MIVRILFNNGSEQEFEVGMDSVEFLKNIGDGIEKDKKFFLITTRNAIHIIREEIVHQMTIIDD